MVFSVLQNKNEIDGKIDMLSNILVIDFEKVIIKDMIRIDSLTEMSLDLIAKTLYGSEDHVDVLLKYNRMNNALELKEGMIVVVPDLESFQSNSYFMNYTPMRLQKKKILFEAKTENKQIPSKTQIQKTKHYRKDSNGNIIF